MSKKIKQNSFRRNFREAFCRVYPVDGYDPVLEQKYRPYKDQSWSLFISDEKEKNKRAYLHHPLSMLSSFLGLPNKSRGEAQSWKNLGFNFIGWNKGQTRTTRLLFRIISPLTALFNTLVLPFKLILSLVKLITEFLPTLIYISLNTWINQIKQERCSDIKRAHTIPYFSFVYYLLILIQYPFMFTGRAITSPWMGVRAAWYEGEKLGRFFKCSRNITICLKLLFAMVSVLVTTVVYTLMLPLAIKFVAFTVLPNLPGNLVVAMGILAKGFAAIGQAGLVLCAKLTGLSFTVATMPELAGIGFLLGLILSIGGAIGNKIYRHFNPENEEYCGHDSEIDEESDSEDEFFASPYLQPELRQSKVPTNFDSQHDHSTSEDLPVTPSPILTRPVDSPPKLDVEVQHTAAEPVR